MSKKKKLMDDMNKTRMLFSVDSGVAAEFRRHARMNELNMSRWIEQQMHRYNVENADK